MDDTVRRSGSLFPGGVQRFLRDVLALGNSHEPLHRHRLEQQVPEGIFTLVFVLV